MTFVGDNDEINTAYLARFDFVLKMVDEDACRDFVARIIKDSSLEDQTRLERAVVRPFGARSAYRTAIALARDLRELPESPELLDCIAELEVYAQDALDGVIDKLPEDRLLYIRSLRTKRKPGQKGGAMVPPDDVSDMDIRPYKVLQLADAIHDFADGSVEGDGTVQEIMRKDIGCVLPEAFVPGENRSRKLTLLDIANKSKFVEIMGANSHLTFGGVKVENPLQDLDFDKHMYKHVDETTDESLVPKSTLHDKNTAPKQHVELFCYGDHMATILDLVELVELRDTINNTFGPNLKFVVDQNALPDHPGEARPIPFIVAWMLGFKNVIKELERYHKVRQGEAELAHVGDLKYCDASIHDGARFFHNATPSTGATGDVYHRDAKIQVNLYGLHGNGYKINNSRTDSGCPINIRDFEDDNESLQYFVRHVNRARKAKNIKTGADIIFNSDKQSMGDLRTDLTDNGMNCSIALALKNAGDWGQIEHCKVIGAVFVTCDKLAALYAAYRNVPLLYLNHHDRLKSGQKGLFLHYSFVLMPKRVPREPPVAAPPLAQSMWGQRGGGFRALHVALAAVTVVAAVIGSTRSSM
jgi:hypothetical protein